MKVMYRGIPFSPRTALSANLGEADTVIPVEDVSAFPSAPNYATIGLDEEAETFLYTALTEHALSGCTRGVEGTAKAWGKGEVVARNFTAADHGALTENVAELYAATMTHQEDGAAHVTQEEKAAWSAKETPEGAQSKADAAKAASRPVTWMPTATEVGAAEAAHTHTAEQVGAAQASHAHTPGDVTGLTGTDYATSRVRGISAGTVDLTAGTSDLESGTIYLVYE